MIHKPVCVLVSINGLCQIMNPYHPDHFNLAVRDTSCHMLCMSRELHAHVFKLTQTLERIKQSQIKLNYCSGSNYS